MSEPTPEASPRVWLEYRPDEDTGEVALPGYVNAIPSYLSPGTVFSADRVWLDELTQGGESSRFVVVDAPSSASPNESLTKAELAAKLGMDAGAESNYTKDELVQLADEFDRLHPEPPGADASEGDGYVPPFDAAVADANAADTDTTDQEVTP